MRALLPPARTIEAELAQAEKSLARRPGTWPRLEAVGRAKRALGHPDWRQHLLEAVASLRKNPIEYPQRHLHVGNLLLLAGQEDAAAEEFEVIVDALAREARRLDPAPEHLRVLIPAAFILRRDRIVDAVARRSTASELGAPYALAALADADRRRDAHAALQIATELAGLARSDILASSGSAPSVWDIVEMAAEVAANASDAGTRPR